jgi:hypothetical protein
VCLKRTSPGMNEKDGFIIDNLGYIASQEARENYSVINRLLKLKKKK